jgi:hypothetical protein
MFIDTKEGSKVFLQWKDENRKTDLAFVVDIAAHLDNLHVIVQDDVLYRSSIKWYRLPWQN